MDTDPYPNKCFDNDNLIVMGQTETFENLFVKIHRFEL